MPSARRMAKRAAETLLTTARIDRVGLRAHRWRTLVLGYHNVIPDGERACGDRSLHLDRAMFAAQLDALATTHDVIPLSAIDDEPRSDRPRAILTFDDAYRGAMTVGLAEIEMRGMHVTVFVAPGLFGSLAWWDRLADTGAGALSSDVRDVALRAGGRADAVAAVAGDGNAMLPEWAAIASEMEVRTAARRPGVSLGAHTWTHANLAALDPRELASECARPMAWLRSVQPDVTPWFAYPYGLTSAAVARAASEAGYSGAFRIDGGWLPLAASAASTRFNLPRLNIPAELSLAGFRLRTAGLLSRR